MKPVLFREVQRFREVWWVMALVLGLSGLQWWMAWQQLVRGVPVGNNPGSNLMVFTFWLIFGIGFPLFFWFLRLEVEVYPDAVTIRYVPLTRRVIPKVEIARVEPRHYSPLGEFGGWGIRGWGGRIAYNVRGKEGVELTLTDGRVVLIGSQRAAELGMAIRN